VIEQAMDYLEKELPGFYRVLVSGRNKVMAKNLKDLSRKFDKIVCVIGAGHEKGMNAMLQ
jgi:pheromone shutdown protein TraB